MAAFRFMAVISLLVALSGILVVPLGASAAVWSVETVETAPFSTVSDPSIKLDTSGRPHISYAVPYYFSSLSLSGSALKLAAKLGSSWTIQVADSNANVVGWTSLALYNNEPRISYYDHSGFTAEQLKYTSRSGSAWTDQIVKEVAPGGSNLGEQTSLALNSGGHPRIAYLKSMNNGSGDLQYISWSGTAWVGPELIADYLAAYPSLALDSSGTPHIAYSYYQDSSSRCILRYSTFSGTWSHALVLYTAGAYQSPPEYTSLAIDSLDRAHILFGFYDGNESLRYIRSNGGGWDVPEEVAVGDVRSRPALAVDGNRDPHVCYYDFSTKKMRYAHRANGVWAAEDITSSLFYGGDCSVAVDSANQPHIAFVDGWGDLRYARFAGGVQTGTVTVNADPAAMNTVAPWTLTGPNGFNQSGMGDQTRSNLTPGDYTITWGDVSGWKKPSPSTATQILTSSGTITFMGTYKPKMPDHPWLMLLLGN